MLHRARRPLRPLGAPRRVLAVVTTGLVVASVVLAASPASASRVRHHEWWLRGLHVTRAWRTSRGSGVTVAVLSTGVDGSQADLTGSVITGPDYTHGGRHNGGPYWGVQGTAVASLIAGHGHGRGGANGVVGIAPAAHILSVRVTLEGNDPLLGEPAIAGLLPDAIASGIRYAVRHGATVIDLPLDPVTAPGAAGAGGSQAERAAVSYALARHAVLVAPAGDGGAGADRVNYPAAYPGVVAVGAFNRHFVKAPFSSHRSYVMLTAPGEGVVAAAPPAGYTTMNSTSAASAVVAGIAALIRSRFPSLTPAQVRTALTRGAVFRPAGRRSDGSGHGTVDAARALAAAAVIAGPASPPRGGPAPSTAPAVQASRTVRATPAPAPAPAPSQAGTLLTGAAAAVGVLVILALALLGAMRLQRRRARASRLARVRAAAEIPVRRATGATGAAAGAGRERTGGEAGTGETGAGREASALVPPAFLSAPHGAAPFAPPGTQAPTWRAPGGAPGTAAFPASALSADSERRGGGHGGARPGSAPPAHLFPAVGADRPAGHRSAADAAGGSGGWRPAYDSPAAPGEASIAGGGPGGAGHDEVDGMAGPGPGRRADGPDASGGSGVGIGSTDMDRGAGRGGAGEGGTGAGGVAPPGAGSPGAGGRSLGAHGVGTGRVAGSYRESVIRRPTVSGGPPWGPAPRPDGGPPLEEEPSPAPPQQNPLPHRVPRTRETISVWDSIAEEAWPGGPRRNVPYQPGPAAEDAAAAGGGPTAGGRPGRASAGAQPGPRGEPGDGAGPPGKFRLPRRPPRPWNPATTTEASPEVPPRQPGQP